MIADNLVVVGCEALGKKLTGQTKILLKTWKHTFIELKSKCEKKTLIVIQTKFGLGLFERRLW